MAENSCMVCLETFTKQPHRKPAACPYCEVHACVKCTQTYLLNTQEDPHCMGCRRAWGREVMDAILLTTFLNGEYKKHRENILLDCERSKLPAAQLILERQKRAEELNPELERLQREYGEYQAKMFEIERRIRQIHGLQYEICAGIDSGKEQEKEKEKERRTFVMPCPVADCRGFLSQSYKCGVCDTYVCPDCREIKGARNDVTHTCDPNNVATVQALKKETRPCPDCGANIFRVEGCSMMWCTACNTPFDWNTGKKVTHGRIHNPHYFEYLRAANGGVMPRDPGDIPCGANLPGVWRFQQEVVRRYNLEEWLVMSLRTIHHLQEVEIPAVTNHAQDRDNTEHNLRYLRNEIDEKRWKQILQQREKRRMKRDELRMQYEAFVGACVDLYGRLIAHATERITRDRMLPIAVETKTQILALRAIFNEGMMLLSRRYKCQVLQLGEENLKMTKARYVNPVVRKKGSKTTSEGSSVVEEDNEVEEVVENELVVL